MSRDFTFIEDIVEGSHLCALKAPEKIIKKLIVIKCLTKFNIGLGNQ